MRSRIKAIVFDMDGTLVDSTEAHIESWIEACKRAKIYPNYEEVRALMGRTSEDIARSILDRHGKRGLSAQELAKRKDELFECRFIDRIRAFPYAKELLEALHQRGLYIAVVSSNPRRLVVKVLKSKTLHKYVDTVVGQDEVNRGKPHPEPILLALSRLRVSPREAIVVGDSTYDIMAAKAAGVEAIGICSGLSNSVKLREAGAKFVFRDLRELYEKLDDILF